MLSFVARAQAPKPSDSVIVRIAGTELRSAVQIVQQYLDRPVIFSGPTPGPQVSLETPRPIPRNDVPRLLRGLLESTGYELVEDTASGTYRARPKEVRAPLVQQPAAPFAPAAPKQQPTAPELFVISLRHARASDVATTINALFGRGNGQSSANSRAPTLADQLRANQVPPVETAPPLPESIPGAAGRAATLSGEVTIVADARANNLLVRANRADFALIQAAVQQIDVQPPQVLIEVLIVEARRDRNFSLSLGASLDTTKVGSGRATATGAINTGSAGLGDFTLHVMGVAGGGLDAKISAAASRGDVKIVSRPVVLAANDEQAEVSVGSQRPFVQVSRVLPTETTAIDQIVQYRDVGTKLNVRPTISIDGTVALAVTQEVSNATTETAFGAPVISTRSVKTDLLVKDSQTIVLGGLTDKEHDVNSSGVPFLSRIPFIGGLFGSQDRATTETELFIFLTPRVIRNDEDAKRITDPLRDRAKHIEP
jgi:general secretion pathway protein D